MLLPKVTISKTWGDKNNTQSEVGQVDLPEKYMDIYEKLKGDGSSKVTVAADLALKDFGSGAGAMVSVTLSCGQDAKSIEEAIDLAGKLAREYCVEQHKLAEQEYHLMKQAELKAKQAQAPYGQYPQQGY